MIGEAPVAKIKFLVSIVSPFTSILVGEMTFPKPEITSTPFFFNKPPTPMVSFLTTKSLRLSICDQS